MALLTGLLMAAESGSDALAGSGSLAAADISGLLAASEAGADIAAMVLRSVQADSVPAARTTHAEALTIGSRAERLGRTSFAEPRG
jgi:hypothetical protein